MLEKDVISHSHALWQCAERVLAAQAKDEHGNHR